MDLVQLLPQDIVLNHIFNLLDVTNRVRAAAVCRAWRDLVREVPASNIPFLFMFDCKHDSSSPADDNNINQYTYHLHDLTTNISKAGNGYNGYAPIHRAIGSGGPFLTLAAMPSIEERVYDYKIYNPFTHNTIQLPRTYIDRCKFKQYPINCTGFQFSSDPPDCLVAAWHEFNFNGNAVYLCRPGYPYWVKGPEINGCMQDMIFFKDKLYGVDFDSHILTFEINLHDLSFSSSSNPCCIAPSCHVNHYEPAEYDWDCNFYLVESDGELLLVTKKALRYCYKDDKLAFTVHRVDKEKGALVRVENLGEKMLFVDQGCSYSCSRPELAFSGDDFFTKNSIYFVHDNLHNQFHRLGKFELDAGSCKFHPSYCFNSWPVLVSHHPNY